MKRPATVITLLIGLAGILAATGCAPDPKERIALLEEENQRLIDDLGMARQGGDQALRDGELCEQELASLRSANDNLRQMLANRPTPQAQPAAPEVPEGWTAVPGGAMIAIEGEVLFDFAKTELRSEARSALDAIAGTIASQYSVSDILVYGHTDNVGIGPSKNKWKDNLELSAQRALSVVRHLDGRGVNPARLVACGCGEHRPIVPNSSAANRAKNRRVEIYALDVTVQTAGR
ncbi:MAG TPA: OmpA family protein [Phycisphaerae bacterium]|nr:OmpA family protein [Phycisphaerae bacterium]